MKATRLITAALLGIALTLPSHAATQNNNVEVSIDFGNPSNYTDIEIDGYAGTREQDIILDIVRSEFSRNAQLYLPNGYKMETRVDDIDLAGYHEPMYPQYDQIRIMKPIYPPRFKFSYAVTNKDGIIVREGNASLTDLNYLWRLALPSQRSQTAFYVRTLIKDWFRDELGK